MKTQKQKFDSLCWEYNSWYTCSLKDCVLRIKETFDLWNSIPKKFRVKSKADLEILVQRCMDQIYRQTNRITDFCGEYERLKDEIPDIDDLFLRLNKEFPYQSIVERFGAWGVIIKK